MQREPQLAQTGICYSIWLCYTTPLLRRAFCQADLIIVFLTLSVERVAVLMDHSRSPDHNSQANWKWKLLGLSFLLQVLLSKHKSDGRFYAIKVLQKKSILKKKELFFHLQRERCFREPRARFYAAEMASAVGYLHSLNIIYRDLKPENILLDCQYLAPEVLKKQPYDRTVDWWCLGAVLYEMLFGLPPFYSRDMSQMYDNILHKPLHIQGTKTIAACDILQGLLHKDQKKRLGAKTDFLEIKNHMFFAPINWDDLYSKKITPPFDPNVAGPADLRHFDPEFTQETVPSSIIQTPDLATSSSSATDAFLGFSYAPNDED
ncbi:hypothetical protein Chor_004070 [Crotalus horridus]